jgi:hypothetical protein
LERYQRHSFRRKEGAMPSHCEYLEWSLEDHRNREYKSEAEESFFETIENPPDRQKS